MIGDLEIIEQKEVYLVKIADLYNKAKTVLTIVPSRKALAELLNNLQSRYYILETVILNDVIDYYDFLGDLKETNAPKVMKRKVGRFEMDENNQLIDGGN